MKGGERRVFDHFSTHQNLLNSQSLLFHEVIIMNKLMYISFSPMHYVPVCMYLFFIYKTKKKIIQILYFCSSVKFQDDQNWINHLELYCHVQLEYNCSLPQGSMILILFSPLIVIFWRVFFLASFVFFFLIPTFSFSWSACLSLPFLPSVISSF